MERGRVTRPQDSHSRASCRNRPVVILFKVRLHSCFHGRERLAQGEREKKKPESATLVKAGRAATKNMIIRCIISAVKRARYFKKDRRRTLGRRETTRPFRRGPWGQRMLFDNSRPHKTKETCEDRGGPLSRSSNPWRVLRSSATATSHNV